MVLPVRGELPRSTASVLPFQGHLAGASELACPMGHLQGATRGEVRGRCHLCMCDRHPTGELHALYSLLRLTCRELWAQGTPSQGADPEMCLEGPSEEAGREGKGQAEATCHYQAPHHLPHLKSGLVPSKQGGGVSVESIAETEAPSSKRRVNSRSPGRCSWPGAHRLLPHPLGAKKRSCRVGCGRSGQWGEGPWLWYKFPHPHPAGHEAG